MVKFPNVTSKIIGQDGNAFNLLGIVQQDLRRGGATKEQRDEFLKECISGDYDHLLQTIIKWVNVA
jgi:hypothetical protein